MMNNSMKCMVLTLFWSCFGANFANPLGQNYTTELLRLAKAASIKAYMNENQAPCDNFYEHSCGRWSVYHPTKAEQMKTSYLDTLQSIFVQKNIDLLKEERKSDTKSDKLLKTFFHSCAENIPKETIGIDVFLDVVDMKGGWPKVESPDWYEYDYDWLQVIAKVKQILGLNVIVGLEIVPDFEDKDLNRIMIGAPQFPLGTRKHYENEDYKQEREKYKNSILTKLRNFFPKMSQQWLEEVSQQVVELEKNLAKGLPINEDLTIQQKTRQRYAGDLKAAYGNFVDMTRYLNIIFNETIYMQIFETPEDYFSNLVDVIRQTPKLTIANYTVWRVLDHFDKENAIQKPSSERQCVEQLIKFLPSHVENLFKRYSNYMELINELQSVWSDIKKVFRDDFSPPTKLAWIQSDIRQKAVQKIDSMVLEMQSHDDKILEDSLKSITFNSSNYYTNLIKLITLQSRWNLGQVFEKPKDIVEEASLPKYHVTENKIHIPIIFLQERFFWDPSYPYAIKYSTLGFLLAQQMLQGFDVIGREYDKYGHRRPWWDALSAKAFEERATCFKNQYEMYQHQNKLVKDDNLVRTAILDNGALNIAYRAYKKWLKNSRDSNTDSKEYLGLLDFTNDKLFFVSFAQMLCAEYNESMSEFNIIPERLRVIGALTNSEDFANGFKCEKDSKMNPANKCVLY